MVEQTRVNQSKLEIKGVGYLQEQYISLTDLRKVSGIGDKTIERIKSQLLQSKLDDNYKSEYNENIKLDINNIYKGDCLELMNGIKDKSIDMILCDLPYSSKNRKITWNEWDGEIQLELLFTEYNRIIKDNGAIVLFAMQPFASQLVANYHKHFKYEWIWQKEQGTGFLNAKRMPLRDHENILVFYKKQPVYNPQFTDGVPYATTKGSLSDNYCNSDKIVTTVNSGKRYPKTVIGFNRDTDGLHPTQKPVELCEYLIRTYTNEGDLILDNCIGSGTTAIASINTSRNYIGIELDENYYNIAKNRINEHKNNICLK